MAIARALAPEPRILIADEPTGNLDQATGRQIADLLFAKARERGMTLVLVTHDPALAARCSRQVAMRSGRIEAAPALRRYGMSADAMPSPECSRSPSASPLREMRGGLSGFLIFLACIALGVGGDRRRQFGGAVDHRRRRQ